MKLEVCETVNIEKCETVKEKECSPVKKDQCDNILEEVCKEVGGNVYSIDLGRLEGLPPDFLQDILTSLAKGTNVRTSWRRSARRWVDLSILCL